MFPARSCDVRRRSVSGRLDAWQQSTTWTRSSTTWTRRVTMAVAGTLTALVALSSGAAAAASPDQGPVGQYVIRAHHGQLPALHQVLRRAGSVVRQVRLIDADVVRLHSADATRLARDPNVVSITKDSRVSLASTRSHEAGTTVSLASVADSIGATDLWAEGITGKGVDVALIDSGIAPVAGVVGDNKVVYGPDLSFDSQDPAATRTDGFGHGTHLAGIIAGQDRATGFSGMAPGARLISVKVADARGTADVSQVIAGIDWVVQHAHTDGLDVRVLNLSFGTDSSQAYTIDPLAYAAEQAWHAGVVVVASVGNDGNHSDGLTDPANDPYVLAVGAANTTTRVPAVASFSSRGDGIRNPDLVARGVRLASLGVPGSTIDNLFGAKARTSDGLFRGSGTSQATAVVTGAVALLLDARPDLTPDQVKGVLTETARRLYGTRRLQGNGLLDVAAAVAADAPSEPQDFVRSTGTGSLEAARGSVHVRAGGVVLRGEQDIFGQHVDTAELAELEAEHRAWVGGVFNGHAWAASGFGPQALGAQAWGSVSWASTSWASTSWASTTWASTAWG